MQDKKDNSSKINNGDSPPPNQNSPRNSKISDFFIDPIEVLKKEFSDNYQKKIDSACLLSAEIDLMLENNKAVLDNSDREIKELEFLNEVVAEVEHKQTGILDSSLAGDVSVLVVRQIQVMRNYCDFFVNKLQPFFVKVKEIHEGILEYMQKIRTAAGFKPEDENTHEFAQKHTSHLSHIATSFDLSLEELEKIHTKYLKIFEQTALNFTNPKFKNSVSTVLQAKNKELHDWTNNWISEISLGDGVDLDEAFSAAIDVSKAQNLENQNQRLNSSASF